MVVLFANLGNGFDALVKEVPKSKCFRFELRQNLVPFSVVVFSDYDDAERVHEKVVSEYGPKED